MQTFTIAPLHAATSRKIPLWIPLPREPSTQTYYSNHLPREIHYYSHSIWPFYPTTTYPWPAYSTRGICYQSDTLTQSAMLKAPDKFDFTAAQMSEINGLIDSGIFSIHPISDLPPKARLLNKIWSYRRKRSPTGAFLKHKSRLCTDGTQQGYGTDYWQTFAPMISWSTFA